MGAIAAVAVGEKPQVVALETTVKMADEEFSVAVTPSSPSR